MVWRLWTRGLLIRRNIADQDLAYFSTWCPAGTSIEMLVAVEGHRWAIEDSFETTKNELGLDHNETRSWHGWHRHVSLVMLAFACSLKLPYRAEEALRLKQAAPMEYGMAAHGWVTLNFAAKAKAPLTTLLDWLDESWRAAAPKKLSGAFTLETSSLTFARFPALSLAEASRARERAFYRAICNQS